MNEMKSVSRPGIILYGLYVGKTALLSGKVKIAFKRLILPVNYWRVTIFWLVVNNIMKFIDPEDPSVRILDIGSPKLISLMLGRYISGTIHATDLCDKAIFEEWQQYWKSTSSKGNVVFEYADARNLQYPNKLFDAVISLSVIHMISPADSGDITAIKEIQSKIRPGGYFIMEVPHREQYKVNYVQRNNFEEQYTGESLFSERQYDDKEIDSRIVYNIQGKLLDKIYLYERFPFDAIWSKLPSVLTTLLAFIEPWIDVINISIANNTAQQKKSKSVILIFKVNE